MLNSMQEACRPHDDNGMAMTLVILFPSKKKTKHPQNQKKPTLLEFLIGARYGPRQFIYTVLP